MSGVVPNPVALVARNAARLSLPVGWINPPAWPLTQLLPAGPALTLDCAVARALAGQLDVRRELAPLTAGAAHTVLFVPKSRARLQMLAHLAAASTQAGGVLWLVGEKKQGVASASKTLMQWTGSVQKLDAARHSMLYEGSISQPPTFSLESYWREFEVSAGEHRLVLWSLPGVFSHGRLDPGTELLLSCLPQSLPGSCVDFGSGCGVIAVVAALRGAAVTAVDSDIAAQAATHRSLAASGLTGQLLDDMDALQPLAPFDTLISNPPFHQGFRTTLETSRRFIALSPGLLRPGGSLYLVGNRFLDYGSDLRRNFSAVTTLADSRGFRVYRAVTAAGRNRLK